MALSQKRIGRQTAQAAMQQVGVDTVISLGPGHAITLEHVTANNLHASYVILA